MPWYPRPQKICYSRNDVKWNIRAMVKKIRCIRAWSKKALQAVMKAPHSTNLPSHLRKTAYVQPENLANRELRIWLRLSTLFPPSSPPTCPQVGTQAPEVSVCRNLI